MWCHSFGEKRGHPISVGTQCQLRLSQMSQWFSPKLQCVPIMNSWPLIDCHKSYSAVQACEAEVSSKRTQKSHRKCDAQLFWPSLLIHSAAPQGGPSTMNSR